ncbi:hypothetical protein EIP86_010524 [Pleurotus ostreatoroseus]|nr:hypothetical protein EIP86_010524 [Pleurotus ostreatoroseus]
MPSFEGRFSINVYKNASALPEYVWTVFESHPRASNVMYPHALHCRHQEQHGIATNATYIVCTTTNLLTASDPSVDFVLSCTDGSLGKYPVFIFTPLPPADLHTNYTKQRLYALACELQAAQPSNRVFSVFAPEAVTLQFCSIWSTITGIPLDPEPEYYAAKITYCTNRSFRPRQRTLFPDVEYTLRLAQDDDVMRAAELCYGFAKESEPFTLTEAGALREASLLIQQGNLWIHEMRRCGQKPEIASIVAVTRTSDTVAAITKVYTNPRWRKRGCAERLTRKVTQQ